MKAIRILLLLVIFGSDIAISSEQRLSIDIVEKLESRLKAICTTANSETNNFVQGYSVGFLSPGSHVLGQLKRLRIAVPDRIEFGKIKVVSSPKNGVLNQIEASAGSGYYSYIPNKGFIGEDRVTFDVLLNGNKIRVGYLIRISTDANPDYIGCDPAEWDD